MRRLLGHDALIADGGEISLAPQLVDCDAARLELLSNEGSCTSFATAADLYQGPLLDGVNIAEEAWDEWLASERLRLEGLALGAMIRHAEQALQSGDAAAALEAAHRAVSVNALREDAHRLVMQALAATGRKAEALKHYQDLVALFKRELNTEPDAATKSLTAELRTTEPPGGSAAVKIAKSASGGNEAPSPGSSFERRQLTIIACSMVNAIGLFSASSTPRTCAT